ncbi:AAA domain-containing protein [Astrocystis sublimbata]|nr:AAA domain-containing protein [Astrocystis sublimbata]
MSSSPSIYIIGSESTGKTTLAKDVIKHFEKLTLSDPPGFIEEVARIVGMKHGFVGEDLLRSKDRAYKYQRLIIEGQFESEQSELQTRSWFISDRSAIDPIIYAKMHVSSEAADVLVSSARWREMKERMKGSLVIVCEAGVAWGMVNDGFRLMSNHSEWLRTHHVFCDTLNSFGLEYHVLPLQVDSKDARLKFVLDRWEEKRKDLALAIGKHVNPVLAVENDFITMNGALALKHKSSVTANVYETIDLTTAHHASKPANPYL